MATLLKNYDNMQLMFKISCIFAEYIQINEQLCF